MGIISSANFAIWQKTLINVFHFISYPESSQILDLSRILNNSQIAHQVLIDFWNFRRNVKNVSQRLMDFLFRLLWNSWIQRQNIIREPVFIDKNIVTQQLKMQICILSYNCKSIYFIYIFITEQINKVSRGVRFLSNIFNNIH